MPAANSDGLLNCLRQPRLLLRRPQKSMRENSHPLFNLPPPGLFPASGTESVGLAANTRGVMVFAIPSRLFHRAPGLTGLTRTWHNLDSFIVHPDSSAVYQDWQKPRHRNTDGNSPNRRAVGGNLSHIPTKKCRLDNLILT
jgi:hypothetical protein